MEYKSVSPSLMWRPSDSLEFYYRYDDSQQDQDANTVQNMAQPDQVFCFFYEQCAQGVTTPQSGDRYDVLQNGDRHDSFFDSEMHIFNARWDISDANRLEYLFGYFTTDEEVYQDWDGTPLTLYHTERPAVYTQRSHELRLTHDADGALTYTVGAYVWNSSYRIDLLSEIGFVDFLFQALPPGTVVHVPQTVQQHTDSYAAFVEARLRLQRRLDVDARRPLHQGRERQRSDRSDHAGARHPGQPRQSLRRGMGRVHAQGGAALPRLAGPDVLRPVLEGLPFRRIQRPRQHLRRGLEALRPRDGRQLRDRYEVGVAGPAPPAQCLGLLHEVRRQAGGAERAGAGRYRPADRRAQRFIGRDHGTRDRAADDAVRRLHAERIARAARFRVQGLRRPDRRPRPDVPQAAPGTGHDGHDRANATNGTCSAARCGSPRAGTTSTSSS